MAITFSFKVVSTKLMSVNTKGYNWDSVKF